MRPSKLATVIRMGVLTAFATFASGCGGSAQELVGFYLIDPCPCSGIDISFDAYAVYSDGEHRHVTNLATWTSSDPAVAIVLDHGWIRHVASGSAEITAAFGGLAARATVTVP